MKTEILKPTTGGYVRMGQVLAEPIQEKARKGRKAETYLQLKSLLEIAAYLGAKGERDVCERLLSLTPDEAE